jgi:hypothetical protein
VRSAAGIVLAVAFLAELAGVLAGCGTRLDLAAHLFGAVAAAAGSTLFFRNVAYSAYVVLPLALGILFYEVYRTVSVAVCPYTIISGAGFFIAALLSFMLIRAQKT